MATEGFISVGNRRIWTRQVGTGLPVLLSLGAGHPGVGYAPEIEERLAPFATVVTYDRAGMGRSDPPASAPTASDMADDMRAVIEALEIEQPLLLTGFSMTALAAQLYACRYPAQVAGLLLLDPTPDVMVAEIADQPPFVREATRRNLAAGPDISPEMAFEIEKLIESAIEVRDAIAQVGLPDVPLMLVTLDREASSLAMTHHRQMAKRVPRGTLLTTSASGHRTFVHENAALIAELVIDMLK